jgi:hypothetical protein
MGLAKGANMLEEDTVRDTAREHVKNVRDFYYHLMVFVVVNALLVIVDIKGGKAGSTIFNLDWAYWIILFWGLGVIGHAIYAFFDGYRVERWAAKGR